MNLTREHEAYRKRGGTLDEMHWNRATLKLRFLARHANNWRERNDDKPLSEAPQYPEMLKLERELIL